MASNLTWWQAADLARARQEVRRQGWLDPLVWITHTPGLFFRHEERNLTLPSPAAADPARHLVRSAEFRAAEFLATDWTTENPNAPDPVAGGDPPEIAPPPTQPPGAPPTTPPTYVPPLLPPGSGGGGPGGSPGGTAGGLPVPPNLPPLQPQPPSPPSVPPPPPIENGLLPYWSDLVASLASGLHVSGQLHNIFTGSVWSCAFHIPRLHLDVLLALVYPPSGGVNSILYPLGAVVGDYCTFTASCLSGPGTLKYAIVTGACRVT